MTKPMQRFAVVLGALMISSLARASDWPQWRGPERTGISKETGLLKEWPADGPKLLWMVKDVGYGFSTPAIVGDRMYLQSNKGKEDEMVVCMSAKDGKPIWSTRIGKVGKPDQMPNYPAARSTPTIDGAFVYALGSDGDLACMETATGKIKWQKSFTKEFGGQAGTWAYSESPLIDGDNLICTPGGPGATMVALKKTTGDLVWKCSVPGDDAAGYSSIVATEIGGVKQYVQFVAKGVIGVEAKTGKFLWRFDDTGKKSPANIPTPTIFNGMVYSGSGLGGGGLCKVTAADGKFTAEKVYFDMKLPRAIGGTVKVGDYLYGTGTTLQCVEFATGNVKWDERSVGAASILYADGRLYLHGENGAVAMIEATPEGYKEKGKFNPSDPPERARGTNAWCYPVISNGKLYIRDLGTIWCYDIKNR